MQVRIFKRRYSSLRNPPLASNDKHPKHYTPPRIDLA